MTEVETATQPDDISEGPVHGDGAVLAFLNEVAGGRKLLEAIRDRVEHGASRVFLAAPQNQPQVGQIVNQDEVREAALSRVEVTQEVLADFGIEAEGAVFDPNPLLALDDAVRATEPQEILISCLYESRVGWMRRDIVETAKDRYEPAVTHIPVRVDDDAVRWDVNHTLVVATQTVNSPELLRRLKERVEDKPHRYTFVCPRSGEIEREEVCHRLARTLAELYRGEIDATGQPMSPEPFDAVRNAVEHYRIDDIVISTFAGRKSAWLEGGLMDQVNDYTDRPVEHVEVGGDGPGGGVEQVEEANRETAVEHRA
jgi:hypothetical protein